ncbi:MAG: CsbD family protein [Planctomycetaceae bacterium]
MNKDQFEGKWKQFKGQVKEKWGELTDDEIDEINGRREQLAGKIQEKYGIAKEAAEEQICDFEKSCKC